MAFRQDSGGEPEDNSRFQQGSPMSAELGKFNKRLGLGDAPKLPEGSLSPCNGCRHAARCKEESLGCEALVLHMRLGATLARLAYAPRFPTAEAFQRAHAKARTVAPSVYRRPALDDDEAEAD
jgi:hypothetical protein